MESPLRKKPSRIRTSVILILAAAALWAGYSYYNKQQSADAAKNASKTTHVEATEVGEESVEQSIKAVGTLLSNESVEIKTEIEGRLASIAFKDGQEVKAKDPLFILDDSVQQAELAKAKANVVLATNNVNRARALAKNGFTSKVGLEESQAELNLARANVQLAEANLEKTVIRAPFDGVVGIRKVSIGDIVTPQVTLVTIDQYSPIKVEFSVPERYLRNLKVESVVMLKSETLGDKEVPATISAIDSRVGEASRGIRVQALSENTDHALFPGQFVTISMKLAAALPLPVIPDQALITNADETFVYVVEGDKAKKRVVKVGHRKEDKAVIVEGLNKGEKVITAGQQKISDGASVKVSDPTPVKQTTSPDEKRAVLQ